MSERDSPPLVVLDNISHEQPPASNTTPLTATPSSSVPLRRFTTQNSRLHSTNMSSGGVYPIAEAIGEGGTNHPLANGRRRSVSSRGIAGAPASSSPPAWTNLSSSLRRSVSDIRGRVDVVNRATVSPPKESPYEEMMMRFQIRQLQRTPSNMALGLEGLVSDFAPPSSSGVTVRTPRSQQQEHHLHSRPSARNISEHLSSVPDLGASFLNFGDGSTFAHPPLESSNSNGQLFEQLNLAHGDLGRPDIKRSTLQDNFFASVTHVWKYKLSKPISPYSKISQARYAIILMATIIYVLWFPLELAFPDQHPQGQVDTVMAIVLGLDVLITLRTSYVTETGTIIVSSWHIVLHYIKTRLVFDLLILVALLPDVNTNGLGGKWLLFMLDGLSVQRLAYIMRFVRMIWLVRANIAGSGSNFWAWVLYSRYSHLFRIAGIVAMVVFIAHYIACIWTILLDEADEYEDTVAPWRDKYYASFYAALLLMQGEGVPAETAAQNLFASLSVVLGSIVLAVVFGHVAILVSNFNANTTSYQRKMEEVFAMTAKLQLPVSLRERIHEYYEHLWHEYECLDGEIVQFSKSLSHSLGLEVVLFKYMEVVMLVPFWKDCTPDFQKQLMLHLDVRVYLPNDFIMRQGEVDVEFYMVNRGYCELDRDADRFERVTTTTLAGRNGFNIGRSNSDITGRRRTVTMNGGQMDDGIRQSAYELDAAQRKYYHNGGRDGKGREVLVSRGQAFGDMALLMNYQRAANVRAVTHVEMCVLSRENFQTVLAKYPEDRRRVVVDMLTSYMQSYEVSKLRCPLLELVRKVYSPVEVAKACAKVGGPPPLVSPTLTVRQAAERIYTAINMESNDATLKFGVGVNIRDKLVALRERRRKKRMPVKKTDATPSNNKNCNSKNRLDIDDRLDSDSHIYSEAASDTGFVMGSLGNATQVSIDPTASQCAPTPPLQERLRQLEEREVAILQGLKELQSSFEILKTRSTIAPLTSRKRLAPGDDATIAKPVRMPLLRRVGSYVGVASGNNVESKNQGQSVKKSPTRYADKLFSQQGSSLHSQQSEAQFPYPERQKPPPRHDYPIRAADSFRFTSDIEPPHSTNESSPADQPPSEAVASSTTTSSGIFKQQPASFKPLVEVPPVENDRRVLFQLMASRSLRALEVAVQARTDSVPALKATPIERRKTFQRTHSQSLRTTADALTTPLRPRSSMTSTQTRALKRMSSFVSDTSEQHNIKLSPTRYADELFKRRSIEVPKEEGWEAK